MRKIALASVLVVLGCSGGSSDKPAEMVDPATQDFCLDYANGVCRLAYLCTDGAAQDAAFHARYGKSLDDCWQGIEKLCTSNQSGSSAFGPSCGPGKKVNDASSTACTDGLETENCGEWMTAPAGTGCQGVCGTTSTSGGGSGSGGTGGMGTGGIGTGGSSSGGLVNTATAYCTVAGELQCERYFECEPDGSAAQFGNLAGCKALVDAGCASEDPCPASYSAPLGSGCVAAIRAATCTELMGPAPAVCVSACQK